MKIPDCYDPVVLEERRQASWDKAVKNLPECSLCRRNIFPGNRFHTAGCMAVCPSCFEKLNENIEIMEEP